jgi:hypothetical protein
MGDSNLEGRERGERRTGGREGDAGRCCTGADSNIDEEEKEEKEAGNKKRGGEERTREAGEEDGGRGEVRGEKEKASRKRAREGRRSGRQMAIVTQQHKKRRKRGEEGRERREEGQRAAQKWKRRVHQLISEREEHEGVKNMEQETTSLVVVKHGRTGCQKLGAVGLAALGRAQLCPAVAGGALLHLGLPGPRCSLRAICPYCARLANVSTVGAAPRSTQAFTAR